MAQDHPGKERYLQYLARAEEARQIALTIRDPQARETWEHIADGWQELAEQRARAFPKLRLPEK
jgi:uncharacterized alpha-E superfamily protein